MCQPDKHDRDDYVVGANANVCDLNRDIELMRTAMLEAVNVDAPPSATENPFRKPFYEIKGVLRRALEATYKRDGNQQRAQEPK